MGSFNYSGEGWGMTNDGKQIYMSDGTSQLRVWDPATLKEIRRITVKDGSREVTALNELEFVRGPQRIGICSWRNFGKCLANRSHRAYRAHGR